MCRQKDTLTATSSKREKSKHFTISLLLRCVINSVSASKNIFTQVRASDVYMHAIVYDVSGALKHPAEMHIYPLGLYKCDPIDAKWLIGNYSKKRECWNYK